MSVDVAHLVKEAPGDTDDQVVDESADSAEGSDTLTNTVVQLNGDDILGRATERDGNMGEVLRKLAWKMTKGKNTLSQPPSIQPKEDGSNND